MNDLLKIAGKSQSGLAKPLSVTDDGNLYSVRKWNSMVEILYPETEITTDTYKVVRSENVKDYGLISLRINNQLGVNIKLLFLKEYDFDQSNRLIMRDAASGNYKELEIGQGYTIITPEEFPFLNYLDTLCFEFKAVTAPSSGSIKIWGVYKG